MKNKILSLLLSFLISASLFAQDWDHAVEPTQGFASINEAAAMAKQIVDAAGLKANFRIAEARVPNAMAVVHDGNRFILYNPKFISILTSATGSKWSAISVLAHEIGHHLYPSNVNKGKIPMASELEADQFSGFVLRKMGASLEESAAAIKLLGNVTATRTHPGRDDRVNSIATGWTLGSEEENNSIAMVARKAPVITSASLPTVDRKTDELAALGIVAKIYFNGDPSGKYYVTKRLNVIKISGNRLLQVGKLARSTSDEYPFIIYDDEGTRVYVRDSGELVTSRGKTAGRLEVNG